MKGIYALYTSAEVAQRAVDRLRAAGVAEQSITILSSEPLEEYEFGQRDRATWMPWISGAGAVVGLSTGYFLTSITQRLWPINTGGMPIVSGWPNLIIIFELTMLGAVLATVITLLLTAKIPSRRPEFYDPDVSGGKILIGVANPRDGESVEHALRSVGRGTVRVLS
jgi:hypothetical protein